MYPLLGFFGGYAIVMLFNPVRQALRDGLRCITRYKRIWLTFVLLGLGYSVFQFATFTPIQSTADFDLGQVVSMPSWHWPRLAEVWVEGPFARRWKTSPEFSITRPRLTRCRSSPPFS